MNWAAAFADWGSSATLIPLGMLAVTVLAAALIVRAAQRRDDFDFGEMLREEAADGKPGKVSGSRVISFGAFGASTWALMTYSVAHAVTDWMWWGYLAAWSLSPVLTAFVSAWRAKGA